LAHWLLCYLRSWVVSPPWTLSSSAPQLSPSSPQPSSPPAPWLLGSLVSWTLGWFRSSWYSAPTLLCSVFQLLTSSAPRPLSSSIPQHPFLSSPGLLVLRFLVWPINQLLSSSAPQPRVSSLFICSVELLVDASPRPRSPSYPHLLNPPFCLTLQVALSPQFSGSSTSQRLSVSAPQPRRPAAPQPSSTVTSQTRSPAAQQTPIMAAPSKRHRTEELLESRKQELMSVIAKEDIGFRILEHLIALDLDAFLHLRS